MADEIDIRELEKTWKSDIGATLSEAAMAVVDAQNAADHARIAYTMQVVDKGSMPFQVETDDGNAEITVPLLALINTNGIGVEEAEIEMDLDVDQKVNEDTKVDFKDKTEAEVGWKGVLGMGPSGSTKTTATMGVSNDKKRSTDYRSSMKVKMKMGPTVPPEALKRITDAMADRVSKALGQEAPDTTANAAPTGDNE